MMSSSIVIFLILSVAALTTGQLVIPGGEHAMATNDEMLLQVLADVQPLINGRLNSPYLHRIVHIDKASAQIVNGLIYHVSFDLGATACLKSSAEAQQAEKCQTYTQTQKCTAQIFSQPWEHLTQLSELQCGEIRKVDSPQMMGGFHEVDNEDEEMKHALLAVEQTMSDQFNSPYVSQVGKVLEAKAQIVAGVKYALTFKFGQTYLLKSAQHGGEPNRRSEVIRKFETCHAQIWAKPGGQQYELLEFKCEVSGEFYSGGLNAIDVHDSEMLGALRDIELDIETELNAGKSVVGRIIDAKAQVVSGIKYYVTFEELGNTRICRAEIWSQPWLKKTELTSLRCDNRA